MSTQQRCRSELRALDEHAELLVIGLILENLTLHPDEIAHKVSKLTLLSAASSSAMALPEKK